jgi:hypothetical protein
MVIPTLLLFMFLHIIAGCPVFKKVSVGCPEDDGGSDLLRTFWPAACHSPVGSHI